MALQITYPAYFIVGFLFLLAAEVPRVRFALALTERERVLTMRLVGYFVLACAVEHAAHHHGLVGLGLNVVRAVEAGVSAATAFTLALRIATRLWTWPPRP